MLKHENACSMPLGKLDNAAGDQVSYVLVYVPDLCPQVRIVLDTLFDYASSGTVACDTPELQLPKAGYSLTTTNELCGKSRTFCISNSTHSECAIHVQIDGTDFDIWICLDLLFYFDRTLDLLLDGSMQIPLLSLTHELRTG